MSEESNITTNIIPLIKANILNVQLPANLVKKINNHIDNEQQNKKDYASSLAGAIQIGEETQLDPEHESLAELKNILIESTTTYLLHWVANSISGQSARLNNHDIFTKKPRFEVNDMWYNKYYEGDYNPLHNHQTPSKAGLSSFLFLKTPDSLSSTADSDSKHEKKAALDGMTYFNYGQSTGHDIHDLVCTPSLTVAPDVGSLWLFPKWLEHGVYPFRGEGERRTLAANVNIWFE